MELYIAAVATVTLIIILAAVITDQMGGKSHRWKCPQGHETYGKDAQFCTVCGAPVEPAPPMTCTSGHIVGYGDQFCKLCGDPSHATLEATKKFHAIA